MKWLEVCTEARDIHRVLAAHGLAPRAPPSTERTPLGEHSDGALGVGSKGGALLAGVGATSPGRRFSRLFFLASESTRYAESLFVGVQRSCWISNIDDDPYTESTREFESDFARGRRRRWRR